MAFKLGRRAPLYSTASFKRHSYMLALLDTLGPPPAQSADFTLAVTVPWGMFLNDQLGDCVCADTAHNLMLRTANAGSIVVPTDAEVLALYEAVGGYVPGDPSTDQGCMENDMCAYLMATGFCGHKSVATAPVFMGVLTPASINHLKWACQIFVGARLGVNLPQSAEDQFGQGLPWDVGGDMSILGGHDVNLMGYDSKYVYVSTWGTIQKATWPWVERYTEEAHMEAWPDAIAASGTTPANFSLNTMVADMALLSA